MSTSKGGPAGLRGRGTRSASSRCPARGIIRSGVRQYVLGLQGRGPRWKAAKLAWLLHRIRPDIVHVHWAHFASLLSGVWRGPRVVTAWGSDIYRRDTETPHAQAALGEALRAAAVVTCDSADLAREIVACSGISPARVEVVQWGVDTDNFHRQEAPAFATELGIAGRPVVFSARNFLPLYNQEMVVEAFARIRDEFPAAVLLLKDYNGDGDYRQRVMARVAELRIADAVRLVETVPHERMAELYSMAAVTVSVPSSDATPMALFEAMACGSVPIFSDLPSLREWIVDGLNGYLVPIGDVSLLAERLRSVLRDSTGAAAMIARNRTLVESSASQAANMRRMEGICRRLLPNARLAQVLPGVEA